MKLIIAMTAAAGLAAGANAQNTFVLSEARVNGGPWGSGMVCANPGDVIGIRVSVDLINTTQVRIGFAQTILQPTLSNWMPGLGDTVSPIGTIVDPTNGGGVAPGDNGRQYPFNTAAPMTLPVPPGVLTTFVDNGDTLRWSGSNNTAGGSTLTRGVGLSQLPQNILGTNFDSQAAPVVFQYEVTLGLGRPGASNGSEFLDATTPLNLINLARGSWYTQPNGLGSFIAPAIVQGVRVKVMPTPGALGLLGVGCLQLLRRRR